MECRIYFTSDRHEMAFRILLFSFAPRRKADCGQQPTFAYYHFLFRCFYLSGPKISAIIPLAYSLSKARREATKQSRKRMSI
jgi:hypothetical protein